jgi:peptide deformylase
MSVRPIVRFPDPLLQRMCLPVAAFDAELAALGADLVDTMQAAPGIGIAGPHIGVLLRVAAIALPGTAASIHVNPVVTWTSEARVRHEEGSISMPGAVEVVERPARVRVAFRDLEGHGHEIEASGLLAVCLQHEIDQLDGIFWTRRLSPLRRDRVMKRFRQAPGRGPRMSGFTSAGIGQT